MVIIKDIIVLNPHPMMVKLFSDLVEILPEPVVTSAYRPGDQGVHGQTPLRGLDIRCHNDGVGELICSLLNSQYIYDPKRPEMKVAKYHDVGYGKHVHLQVHPNTIRR